MEPITFAVTVERIRQLGSRKGSQMNSTQADAFLCVFRSQIEDELARTVKNFVEGKLGIPRAGTI